MLLLTLCLPLAACEDQRLGEGTPGVWLEATVLASDREPVSDASLLGWVFPTTCGELTPYNAPFTLGVTDAAGRVRERLSVPLARDFVGCLAVEVIPTASSGLSSARVELENIPFREAVDGDTTRFEIVLDPASGA